VTCGGAPYSIGPLKFFDGNAADPEKHSDCRDNGQPNGLIT
jgi:hypothetical protein